MAVLRFFAETLILEETTQIFVGRKTFIGLIALECRRHVIMTMVPIEIVQCLLNELHACREHAVLWKLEKVAPPVAADGPVTREQHVSFISNVKRGA